ncbi:MAG: hypothetical protein QF357_00820 [Dehalococcoidia bacterium]|nr:hypothetical protein [Dehalococcoidia bacterium]
MRVAERTGVRRELLILVAGVGSLVAVACGSTDSPGETAAGPGAGSAAATETISDSRGAAGPGAALTPPEPGWTAISEEIDLVLATPDLGTGTQRFGIVLSDDRGLIRFPVVKLTAEYFPDGYDYEPEASLTQSASSRFYEFPFGTRGIHSTVMEFGRAGLWSVSAEIPRPDGTRAPFEVRFPVTESAMSVTVGEQAPASDSRTLASVGDIAELTTGSHRDSELYRYSIADALDRDRPLMIVFASPAFCTNAVCGPQVEVVSELREEYGDRVDFVHIDLYSNPHEIQGDLSRARFSPVLAEWGLVSQEWTFIVGADGIVTHRFENFAPKPELIEALEQSVAVG